MFLNQWEWVFDPHTHINLLHSPFSSHPHTILYHSILESLDPNVLNLIWSLWAGGCLGGWLFFSPLCPLQLLNVSGERGFLLDFSGNKDQCFFFLPLHQPIVKVRRPDVDISAVYGPVLTVNMPEHKLGIIEGCVIKGEPIRLRLWAYAVSLLKRPRLTLSALPAALLSVWRQMVPPKRWIKFHFGTLHKFIFCNYSSVFQCCISWFDDG